MQKKLVKFLGQQYCIVLDGLIFFLILQENMTTSKQKQKRNIYVKSCSAEKHTLRTLGSELVKFYHAKKNS